MRGMLNDNKPLAEFILRILMRDPELKLESFTTQADMKRVTGARSVILDGYGADGTGRKIDLEVQRADKGAEPKRAFYNLSVMAVENLDAGQDFGELPDLYTIFITEKDFFGRGRSLDLYQFKNPEGSELGDGANILYVNGEYKGSDDIGYLMHDFNCTDPNDMHFPEMAERTRYLKENPKGVSEMCKAMEDMRNEAEARGKNEGKILGAIDILKDEGHADEEIVKRVAEKYNVPEDFVRGLMHTVA